MKFTKVKLNDICNLITCGVAKRPNYVGTGVPFLSARNVKKQKIIWNNFRFITQKSHEELTKHNKPLKGDILYTRVGSYGEAAIVEEDREFSLFVSLTLIKPKHDIVYNKFLVYFLNSPMGKLLAKNNVNSSGVGNLNVGKVRNFEIFLPSLQEQQRIVAKLDTEFAGIDKSLTITKSKLKNTETLFQNYLIKVFKTNDKDWKNYSINQLGKVITGNTPKTNMAENYGNFISFVKPGDFKTDGSINFDKQKLSKIGMSKSRIVKKKSTLMVCIGATIGKSGYTDIDITTNQQINSVTPTSNFNHKFIYYQMITVEFQNKIMNGYGQATLPIINKSKWQSLTMKFPNLDEQLNIVRIIDNLKFDTDILKNILLNKIDKLSNLKLSILKHELNGELKKAS